MVSRIIVVGGGASGLMAAGRAAELGARVLLVEKTKQLGTKLRLTGNQHCNLGNDCTVQEFLTHLVGETQFVRNALARFYVPEMRELFLSLGVPLVTDPDRRMFPASRNAHQVASALRRYCLDGQVVFRYGSPAQEILVDQGRVVGLRLSDRALDADAVILCTGGMSYPKTGSTGDGYGLAQQHGHTIAPLHPGLVGFTSDAAWLEQASGVALSNVAGQIRLEGHALASARGDLLLTHQGVSGPLAFSLSSRMGPLAPHEHPLLELDLMADVTGQTLDQQLLGDLSNMGRASYRHLVRRYVPETLVSAVAAEAGVSLDHALSRLTAQQRQATVLALKGLSIALTGTAPMREAMVTLGGVLCSEVWPQTMASRIVPGLYLAGEILDVAGADTGGYNLQLAFSTGYVAGTSAAYAAMED